jgi:flagellar biogenesis protein FliO
MSEKEQTTAEKELAKKNMRLVIILGLVAVGFYVGIVMIYM